MSDLVPNSGLAEYSLQFCQGQNFRKWRYRVIDKSTPWNGVMYYIGEEFDLAIV